MEAVHSTPILRISAGSGNESFTPSAASSQGVSSDAYLNVGRGPHWLDHRVLVAARHGGHVPGTTTDRMILAVARIRHPGRPHARLRERIKYMYLVLLQYEDGLRGALSRHPFQLAGTEPAPHRSLGHPKHRLAVTSALLAMDSPR